MHKFAIAITAMTMVFVASCNPRGREVPLEVTGATLEGTVTYDGQPVPLVMVIVAPASGRGEGATAFADDEGHYKVNSVPLGDVKIAVNSDAARGQMMGRAMAGTDPNAKKGGKRMTMPKVINVPKMYQNPDTSGITTTINKGPNTFEIVIPKK